MSCIVDNPINGNKSYLYSELEYFYNDTDKALEIYEFTQTQEFVKQFGDWSNPDNHKDMIDRIYPTGEPELFTNKFGKKYFKLQNGDKFFLNKTFTDYTYEQRNALITTSITYLLGDNILSKEDVQELDFSKLYMDSYEQDGEVNYNYAHLIMEGNKQSLAELEDAIRTKIGMLSYDTDKDREAIDDLAPDEYGRVLDLRETFEKNSKDNASANIKFLLSFIPKINEQGVRESVEFEFGDELIELPTYYNFDELWNYFEETLANMYSTSYGNTTVEMFDKMVNTLRNKYGEGSPVVNPTMNYLLAPEMDSEGNAIGPSILEALPAYKKNQFVHAFLKSRVNFYTFTIDKTGGKFKVTVFDSADVTSRAKKVKSEILDDFRTSKVFDLANDSINKDLIHELESEIIYTRNGFVVDHTKDSFTYDDLGNIIKQLQSTFKKMNMNISEVALARYIDSYGKDSLFSNVDSALDKLEFMFNDLTQLKPQDVYTNKGFVNPLSQKKVISQIAEYESETRKDVSENTILGPQNKRYWVYSLPNFLTVKLSRIKDNGDSELGSLGAFYQNSRWLDKLVNQEINDGFQVLTFNNLKIENERDAGVDNKSITQEDQLAEMLNKSLLQIRSDYNYSINNTPAPADKGKSLNIRHDQTIDTKYDEVNGKPKFSNEIIHTFKGYFIDEYLRMQEVYDLLQQYKNADEDTKKAIENELIVHYHWKGDKLFETDEEGNEYPAGNGFKFTLFDDMNPLTALPIQSQLFDRSTQGKEAGLYLQPIAEVKKYRNKAGNMRYTIGSDELNSFIENNIQNKLADVIKTGMETLQFDEKNGLEKIIDEDIFATYLYFANNDKVLASKMFLSDSLLNQTVSNIEFAKVFSGDYAYYKNIADYSKRIPATYTDGIYLNMKNGDPSKFTYGVIKEFKIDTELYKGVDGADAQGFITLDRWKFLMERLHKWSPRYEEAFQRMKSNEAKPEDYKLAAQPLKGVYFDVIDGVPTYLKYSQMVLHPKAVEGMNIKNLYDAMIDQGMDEIIVESGVKVGAITPTDPYTEKGFKNSKDIKFNKGYLNNHSWKLQQDLSPKGMKQTLLGSQVPKILIGDIQMNKKYNGVKGSDLIKSISDNLIELSNIGLERLAKRLDINLENGKIGDREGFYEALIQSLKGIDPNTLDALKSEYDLDYILTNRTKMQNILSALINESTVNLKTNGGSFIQSSSVGWSIEDAKKAGVKMLVEESELKAPTIDKKNKKVIPGSVFITHQEIARFIPNYKELSTKELREKLDDRLLELVGYRIPNQDFSSNDTLQVAGILPEGYGDTIIPYIDITAKTGSDFDIDKMYIMLPNISPKYSKVTFSSIKKKLEPLSEQELINILLEDGWQAKDIQMVTFGKDGSATKKKSLTKLIVETIPASDLGIESELISLDFYEGDDKKGIENKLLENFKTILTAPEAFSRLTESLDNDTLKDDITSLHGEDELRSSFEFFSPIYQLQKKFDNYAGKTGTGILANNRTHHSISQYVDLKVNLDLGVGYAKENETSLSKINSKDSKTRISQILSWFLTAYVDIAKDPYITKGNHNNVTSSASMLLIRAGAPIKWVNRLVGQESIKMFVEETNKKKSKLYTSEFGTPLTLSANRIFDKMEELSGNEITEDERQARIDNLQKVYKDLGDSIRKNKLFTEKAMENTIKSKKKDLKYWENQLNYLYAFDKYNSIGSSLTAITNNTKYDVDGASPSIADMIIKEEVTREVVMNEAFDGVSDIMSPSFFVGAMYKNSAVLANVLYANEFVTASPFGRSVLKRIYNSNIFSTNKDRIMKDAEASLYSYIISKESLFNFKPSEIEAMLVNKDTAMQTKVEAMKEKYSDNVLLQSLIPANIRSFRFVGMDNISNKPDSFKKDLANAWVELHENEPEFSLELIKYSYLTSNFKFNSKSFFEYAPKHVIRNLIEGPIQMFKNSNLDTAFVDEFMDYFYKHNTQYVKDVKVGANKSYSLFNGKKTKGHLVIKKNGIGPSFIKRSLRADDGSYKQLLYKQVGYLVVDEQNGDYRSIYRRVSPLGFNEGGYRFYENNRKNSILADQKLTVDTETLETIANELDRDDIVQTLIVNEEDTKKVKPINFINNGEESLSMLLSDGLIKTEC